MPSRTPPKRKIAVLARVINYNSGARAPIKLAESLADTGNDVFLYATDFRLDKDLFLKLKKKGIQINLFRVPNLRIIGNIVGVLKIYFLFRNANFDFVSSHTHTAFSVAAKLSGNKIIRTYYGTQLSQRTIRKKAGLDVDFNLLGLIKAFLWDQIVMIEERISYLFSDNNITISKYLQKEYKELYGKKIINIYLGAETAVFNKNSLVKNSKPKELVTILSVSRIVPYKGFDLIIKAFLQNYKKYKNIRLNIIGSNPDREYLNYLNKIKNGQVSIIQNPSDEKLLEYYRDCDIYASGDLWVPWSLTPLEASFLAKPILGYNRGAMGEIIEDKVNGYLAADYNELVINLEKLILDQKLREKMGAKARELVLKKFNWKKTAQEYLEVFLSTKV